MTDVLPLVGVLLGATAAYVATGLTERARSRRDLAREWRLRNAESYLGFLTAVKDMRLCAAQLAAARGLDNESNPAQIESGMRRLVTADDRRGAAYEHVNVYGAERAILAARALNRSVWAMDWLARGRHPEPTVALWREQQAAYAAAADDFIEAVRKDLQVPGTYARRPPEDPHAGEKRSVP